MSSYGPNNISVWNLRDYQLVKQFEFTRFANLEFSHDGQLLATASQLEGLIVIWDLKTGARQELQALPYEIAFSPKQALLAAAEIVSESGPAVRVWDTATYQATPLFYQSEPPPDGYGGAVSVDFSSEGSLLAAIVSYQLRIWSLDGNQEIDHPLFKSFLNLVQVRASAGGIVAVLDQLGIVTVLNANTGEIIGTTKIKLDPDYPIAIALSPDGHYLLTGGIHRLLQLWEIPQA